MLGVVPPGAQAELDAAGAHGVDLCHLDGEQPGQAERGRSDERSQADALGLSGDGAEGDPRVGRAGEAVAPHGEEVVGAEEGVEADRLSRLRHLHLLVVGSPELWLDEDAELHEPKVNRPCTRPARLVAENRGRCRLRGWISA